MPLWLLIAANAAVIVYAALGGLFLTFSDFLMRSLTASSGGAEAMQAINRDVFRSVFMLLFLGTAAASPVLAAVAIFAAPGLSGWLTAVAGLVYFVGAFGVTAAFNVPLNNRLAHMKAAAGETTGFFRTAYAPRWTAWNTVRTIACLSAAALQLTALALAA
jgi:uncharacterized membrane protein